MLVPLLFATYFSIAFVKGVAASTVSLALSFLVYFLLARRLEYDFNQLTFVVYFYFYSPLWLLIILDITHKSVFAKENRDQRLANPMHRMKHHRLKPKYR